MTSTASATTWDPPTGRHNVTLGSSLTRALKTRQNKGNAQPSKSLHGRDFYSFRYNFKPGQVDSGGRGKITLKKGKESSSVPVSVEHPSTRPGEMCLFNGEQMPAKELDCVLIFDEVSGTFNLEKLDSIVKLNYARKFTVSGPTSPPPAQPTTSTQDSMNIDLEEELERELSTSHQDMSDGEIDTELLEEIIPSSFSRKAQAQAAHRREEEEEDEEEDIPMAIITKLNKPPPAPAPAPAPTKAKAKAPPKSGPKATPKAAAAATPAQPSPRPTAASKSKSAPPKPTPVVAPPKPTKAAPQPRPKKKREPEPVAVPPISAGTGDVEILSFGKPAKRPRLSPPPTVSEGLALPGSSSAAVSRPPPVTMPVTAPPAPIAAVPMSESEDEDWDEVAAVDPVPTNVPTTTSGSPEDDFDIFGDAGMNEDDEGDGEMEDVFANQLDKELGLSSGLRMDVDGEDEEEEEEEDFLADVVEEAPPSAVIPQREGFGGPISLKAYAGGGGGDEYGSEDSDYSSDESEEE